MVQRPFETQAQAQIYHRTTCPALVRPITHLAEITCDAITELLETSEEMEYCRAHRLEELLETLSVARLEVQDRKVDCLAPALHHRPSRQVEMLVCPEFQTLRMFCHQVVTESDHPLEISASPTAELAIAESVAELFPAPARYLATTELQSVVPLRQRAAVDLDQALDLGEVVAL